MAVKCILVGQIPAEVYYIDLEGSYPNYTCQAEMADIKAAYEAGKVLECRCALGLYTATLPLFVPMPSANTWIFSGAGALTAMDFDAQSLTVAIVNGDVQASQTYLATKAGIPRFLPNPAALIINSGSDSVTYDGSEEKTIDIPAGPQGVPGKTPVKGTDYFTATDKQELVDAVIAALPNGNGVSY